MKRTVRLLVLPLCALMAAAALAEGESASGDGRLYSVFSSCVRQIARSRGIELSAAVALLKEEGVAGFDSPWSDQPGVEALIRAGLKPSNLYGHFRFRAPDGSRGEMARVIAFAKKVGAKRLMTFPENFTSEDEAVREAEFAEIARGFEAFAQMAKQEGIAVTIEDYGGGVKNMLSYAKWMRRLFDACPTVRFALDSGNLYYANRGDDIRVLMRDYADRIDHVHLKDQSKDDPHSYTTLGEGAVPNEEIVRFMIARGYSGWFTIENPVGDDRLADVRRQIARLRSWAETDGEKAARLRALIEGKAARLRDYEKAAYSAAAEEGGESVDWALRNLGASRGTVEPKPQTAGWWRPRHEERLRQIRACGGTFDLVLFGDSISHNWESAGAKTLEEIRRTYSVLVDGFSGDRTYNAIWRALNGELDGFEARVITLLIGTNNWAENTVEETVADIRRLVAILRERQPKARILLMPILPRSDRRSAFKNRKSEEINAGIAGLADGERVIWFDLRGIFAGAPKELMPDGLHPGAEGYIRWWKALKPLLESARKGD